MEVRIRLTGEVAVVPVTGPAVAINGLRTRLVLAALARTHRPQTAAQLAEAVWGEALPSTWPDALRGTVRRLRTLLAAAGGIAVVTVDGGWLLQVSPGCGVDVLIALDDLGRARRAVTGDDPAGAARLAEAAAAVLSSPVLPSDDNEWLDRWRWELSDAAAAATELAVTAYGRAGDHASAAAPARRLVSAWPLRESAHRALMTTLAAGGNRAEALRAYTACREILAEEVGAGPSPETEALYLALLREPATTVDPPTADPRTEPTGTDSQAAIGGLRQVLAEASDRPARRFGPRVATTGEALAGRLTESAVLRALVSGPLPAGLVVTGEPGIGKTSLLRDLVRWAAASRPDITVMAAWPAPGELDLAYSTIRDLFRTVDRQVFEALPAAQHAALGAALLTGDAGLAPEGFVADSPGRTPDPGVVADPGIVAAAVGSVLGLLAAAHPVLMVIDDLPWVDRSSAGALGHALRRLDGLPLALAGGRRDGLDLPPALLRAFDGWAGTIGVGPLGPPALGDLIRRWTGRELSRTELAQVHNTTGGNPLFAVEVCAAGALDRPPGSVEEAVRRHLLLLPPQTRDVLHLLAAAAEPTMTLLSRLDGCLAGLRPAFDHGVVELVADRVRFTHPLLEWAVAAAADPATRREDHRRLAAATLDPEVRAHHLAFAHDDPDARVAADVAAGGAAALSRLAPANASDLYAHAARLCPPDDPATKAAWQLTAADAAWRAGSAAMARQQLLGATAETTPGPQRVEALWWLGVVEDELGDWPAALLHWEGALAGAGLDDLRRARVLAARSRTLMFLGRRAEAESDVAEATRLTAATADPETRADVAAVRAWFGAMSGEPPDVTGLAVVAAETAGVSIRYVRAEDRPASVVADLLRMKMDLDTAREAYEALLSEFAEHADDAAQWHPLYGLVQVELLSGRWTRADRLCLRLERDARHLGVNLLPTRFIRLLIDAHRGDLAGSAEGGEALQATAEAAGEHLNAGLACSLLGFVALSDERFGAARAHLAASRAYWNESGVAIPFLRRFTIDEAEACVMTGALDAASELVEDFARSAARADARWAEPLVARTRALIAARAGAKAEADAQIEVALSSLGALPIPFERARTYLSAATIIGDPGHADSAARAFGALGASAWLRRCAPVRSRVGRPTQPPS